MMKRMFSSLIVSTLMLSMPVLADPYAGLREGWMQKGEALLPELKQRQIPPTRLVLPQADAAAFQGLKMVELEKFDRTAVNKELVTGDSLFFDFGEHIVGYITLKLNTANGQSIDGPVQIELLLDEVPSGVVVPPSLYQGWISSGWLQNERITVDQVPFEITLPRRYAFRYVRVNVINGSSFNWKMMLTDMEATSVTSAGEDKGTLVDHSPLLNTIDSISIITLRDCMQTILEDGPKRDRRIWIGDLRLQALANYESFKNADIIKRSLYLLAAVAREDGLLLSTLYERPTVMGQAGNSSLDYALLYNVTLLEYLEHYGDTATAADLWPVALKQTELAWKYTTNGLFATEDADGWWRFFDWCEGLDKTVTMQGCIAYTFDKTAELAKRLGKNKEAQQLAKQADLARKAAKKQYYDKNRKLFVAHSGQLSYASQIWMVLGGVVKGKEANELLKRMTETPGIVKPGSPYLYHYYLEALYLCGENDKVKEVITDYWGGMVLKGADTFWEVYDPSDEFLTPYKKGDFDYVVNSYCHAWSCTPVYFLRRMK